MSFGNEFVPFDINLIEEGCFMEDVHREVGKVQQQLAGYVDQYGEEARKAKASVTIKIDLEVDSVKDKTFKIKGSYKSTGPNRPKRTTSAFLVSGQRDPKTGKETGPQLFIRGTGSTPGDPRQMHLNLGTQVEPVKDPAESGKE